MNSIYALRNKSAEMGVPFNKAALCRFRYVREQLLLELADLEHFAGLDDDSSQIVTWTAWERFVDCAAEQRALWMAVVTGDQGTASITDAQIEQARAVPIEQIVQFDRQGKALAFCHPDRRPSLSWDRKHNRAHCFPCGRSFNAVDVLVHRDGLSFVEAVHQLTR